MLTGTNILYSNIYTKLNKLSLLTKQVRFGDAWPAVSDAQVHEWRHDTLHHAEHRVQTEGEQHQEEEDGPQLRHRKLVDGFRERDKHQARPGGRLKTIKCSFWSLFITCLWLYTVE